MKDFNKDFNIQIKQIMIEQTHAIAILATCLLLGLLGAILFNSHYWGINITLFGLLLAGSFLLLRHLDHHPISLAEYALGASGLFFTLTFAWRDSLVLNSLSLLGILLTAHLAFTLGSRQKLPRFEVSDAFLDLFLLTRHSLTSYHGLIYQDIHWPDVQQRWGQLGRAIVRGVIIAIPLLIGFAFLLMESDPRFKETVRYFLHWDLNAKTVLQYVITLILCSWIAAAVLRGNLSEQSLGSAYQDRPQNRLPLPTWGLGCVEIGIILSAINLLFLAFLAVQFTYYFGGDALVQSLEGPTYADYARRGFFQLVMVALCVMTLLLFIHWLYKPYHRFEKRLYQSLAGLMIVMTLIIEASAAHRMYLYTKEYGLTELRLYSSVFMIWLGVLFLWFSVTVLREYRAIFTFGAILTALFFIGLLHIANPDAWIAEINLIRLQTGKQFDVDYLSKLSADAIPTLVKERPEVPISYHCQLWEELQYHPVLKSSTDWRDFNLARYQGRELLSQRYLLSCE
ncbi:MAG: DUF4173 domain-containing protein [Candidatus Parabeggiatoa sp.]|nr:DUF4173 domain-containing protein [Candidatus Parabeggiatoa sp.]